MAGENDKISSLFKTKKILLASWLCSDENFYQNRDWIPLFREFFGNLIVFSPRDSYLRDGKEEMNKKFLEIISKEKPDYVLCSLGHEEFYPETLMKIKSVSPNSIIVNFFGDDNCRFDDWSRYYALFFDYILATEKDLSDYKKDGIKDVYFLHGVNTGLLKPLNIEKKFDVTFIGMPIRDRHSYIKYLCKKGIKIRLFGPGWQDYKDLKEIYGDFLSSEDYIKVINQSKINLNFSKNILQKKGKKDTQLKGRILEILSCNAFLLIEYFPDIHLFFKNKYVNKVAFKTKEELLKKINYYLKNKGEREKIAGIFRKEVIKNYDWRNLFRKFFKITLKSKESFKPLPKLNKKISVLSENDMNLGIEEIKEKVRNSDYVCFSKNWNESLDFRNFFQAYSLEKSKKPISCCDYYVFSRNLGDYLWFMSKKAFKTIPKQEFDNLLNINQLMITKDYFLKNFSKFKNAFQGKAIDFIDEDNTVFISIPLIRVEKLKTARYKSMKSAFRMKFVDKLYSLSYKKKLFLNGYVYNLLFFGLTKENFILIHIFNMLFNKNNWRKLKNLF